MRSRLLGLAAVLVLGSFATPARAQNNNGGFSDPFFLYYGWYLPRQSAIAAQPQPEDFYRSQAVERQYAAQTDRAGLYDPAAGIGMDELDPLRPVGQRSKATRMARTVATGLPTSIARGRGTHNAPGGYYNNVGRYYPSMRTGRASGGARSGGYSSVAPMNPGRSSFVPGPPSGFGGR